MTEPFKNFESRITAVQTLYSYYIQTQDSKEINTYRKTIKTKTNKNINQDFVIELVDTAIHNHDKIDSILEKNLDKHESVEKLMLLLRAILRLALAEKYFFNTPDKVVINEYVKITTKFFDVEVAFVNAILDRTFAVKK